MYKENTNFDCNFHIWNRELQFYFQKYNDLETLSQGISQKPTIALSEQPLCFSRIL